MNIVVISRNTYPIQGPRAFRTAELTEELMRRGHKVTLYIADNDFSYEEYNERTGVIIKKIPLVFACKKNQTIKNFCRRILGKLFKRLLAFPDIEFRYAIWPVLKKEKGVDLLITIAVPHPIHWGAALAKKKLKRNFPKYWIADCGDPFMYNPFINYPAYFSRIEKDWCRRVDFITVPTEASKDGYYPEFKDKIHVIPQGFDFSKTPIEYYQKNAVPTFIFVGAIYPGIRDPHSFMNYLLTYDQPYKFRMFIRTPLEDYYLRKSHGQIEYVTGLNRSHVIKECSKADFLINITNPNSIQTPSKLIDYGISGRPILDIDNNFSNQTHFLEFIKGDYTHCHIVDSLESYKIENVVQQFMDLLNYKNED